MAVFVLPEIVVPSLSFTNVTVQEDIALSVYEVAVVDDCVIVNSFVDEVEDAISKVQERFVPQLPE